VYLDVRTLQVVTIIVCIVLGPVSLAFHRAQAYMQPSRFWGAALVALAGGLALINLHTLAPDFVSKVLGPGLLGLTMIFAETSARSMLGQSRPDVLGWTYLGLFFLALLALQSISADAWLHHMLAMGMLGFLACRTAYAFHRCGETREGRPLRAIAILFLLFGAAMVLRGLLFSESSESQASPDPVGIEGLMLVGLIAGLLLGTILLLWVMSERFNQKLRQIVSADLPTGTLNRPAFIKHFEREVSRSRRLSASQFAILLVDVDHLGRISDAYGHRTGDRLLEKTVEVLRGIVRAHDLIGRLEGDAFVLLLPGTQREGAVSLAERARGEIEKRLPALVGIKNPATVSIGIAVFGEHGDSWDAMLRVAETAAQRAKDSGGNRVEVAAPIPRPHGSRDTTPPHSPASTTRQATSSAHRPD